LLDFSPAGFLPSWFCDWLADSLAFYLATFLTVWLCRWLGGLLAFGLAGQLPFQLAHFRLPDMTSWWLVGFVAGFMASYLAGQLACLVSVWPAFCLAV